MFQKLAPRQILHFIFTCCVVLHLTSTNASITYKFISASAIYILVIAIWKIVVYPKALSPLRHFPEPPGGSFFNGQLRRILHEPAGAPMQDWINSVPNNGIIRFTTICNQERLILTSSEALKEVLVTKNYDWDKPKQLRLSLGRLVGQGILVASGEDHKSQRKHLLPAFSLRLINDLYPVFWSKSCEMLDAVTKVIVSRTIENNVSPSEGAAVNMTDWLRRVTLDIIGVAGMGYNFNALSDPENELNNAYDRVFNKPHNEQLMNIIETMENLVPVAWLSSVPLKHNHETDEGAASIRRMATVLIDQKRLQVKENSEVMQKDVLSVAIDSDQITDRALVDQVMTFLAAGHETVSTAMTWAIVSLCRHPEIQNQLREEIRSELLSPIKNSRSITPQDINRLPYLQAVCNEVLRYHAPVPLSRRECIKDTTILGHPIPKGTNILLVPAAVNCSKTLWGKDAAQFRPERWIRSNGSNIGGSTSTYANLTFMHGPRSCIGMSFAKAEFACLLAAVAGRFEIEFLEPDQNIDILRGGVTLRLKHDLSVRMKVIKGW